MKWRDPQIGTERTRIAFAWLPVGFRGTNYWLERVAFREVRCKSTHPWFGDFWRIIDVQPAGLWWEPLRPWGPPLKPPPPPTPPIGGTAERRLAE